MIIVVAASASSAISALMQIVVHKVKNAMVKIGILLVGLQKEWKEWLKGHE